MFTFFEIPPAMLPCVWRIHRSWNFKHPLNKNCKKKHIPNNFIYIYILYPNKKNTNQKPTKTPKKNPQVPKLPSVSGETGHFVSHPRNAFCVLTCAFAVINCFAAWGRSWWWGCSWKAPPKWGPPPRQLFLAGYDQGLLAITHTIHVWYIYLHLVVLSGKIWWT